MALGINNANYVINVDNGVASSLTDNLTTQIASGGMWLVTEAWFFSDTANDTSITAPTGLTIHEDRNNNGGTIGGLFAAKLSTGSDGTTVTTTKSGTQRRPGLFSAEITDAGNVDTTGGAGPITASTITATTGTVTTNGSLAVFVVFRSVDGVVTEHTFSDGYSEWNSTIATTGGHVEVYIATKTVNSGSTTSCTWTRTVGGNDSRLVAGLFVFPPLASAPTITVPGSQHATKGIDLRLTDITIAEGAAGDIDMDFASAVGTTLTVVTPGTVAVTGNGTNALQCVGTLTELNTMLQAGIDYNNNTTTDDTITVDATDSVPTSATQKTIPVTMHKYDISGGTLADKNAVMETLKITHPTIETATVTFFSMASTGATDTDTTVVTVEAAPPAGTEAGLVQRKRRRARR